MRNEEFRFTSESGRRTIDDSAAWNEEEARISDGAGRLCARSGHLEDILQFALEPEPVRPVPEVVEIEVHVRILDNAQCILEVCGAAHPELQQDQVLGRRCRPLHRGHAG